MPRAARIVIPTVPHHITQRTVRRLPMFNCDLDRKTYLSFFDKERRKFGIKVWAYCLMDNHVHWILVPSEEEGLSLTIRNAHSKYSRFFNTSYGFVGHLMQSRFYSRPMRDNHFWAAVRYVERNPVEAGLVKHASHYPWSSARAHCMGYEDPYLDSELGLPEGGLTWSEWLEGTEDDRITAPLTRVSLTGNEIGK
jgi:putative transposase